MLSGYRQIEYIKSTGTQYINTGYIPATSRIKVELKVLSTSIPAAESDFFGNYNGSAGIIVGFYQGKVFQYSGNNGNLFNTGLEINQKTTVISEWNTIRKLECSGTEATSSVYSLQPIESAFCLFSGGVNYRPSSITLYSCKMYDNEELVRDFVPCVDSSGNAGLYDLINDVFYKNAGTGDFVYPKWYQREWESPFLLEWEGLNIIDIDTYPDGLWRQRQGESPFKNWQTNIPKIDTYPVGMWLQRQGESPFKQWAEFPAPPPDKLKVVRQVIIIPTYTTQQIVCDEYKQTIVI